MSATPGEGGQRAFWWHDGAFEPSLPDQYNDAGLDSSDDNLLLESEFRTHVKHFIKSFQTEHGELVE